MLEIWGRRNSSNVIPIMWAVGETGEAWRRHDAGGSFGGLDTPEYRAMNPNGLVPTLSDDGFVVRESNAIIRYLAAKYDVSGLWAADPAQRSLADRWMEWHKSTGSLATMAVFFATVRTEPADRDQAYIARKVEAAAGNWQFVDAQLAERPYLAGDSLTMGDLPMGALAHRYFQLDIDRPSLPHVTTWYERLAERPAYAEHCMFELGANPAEWLSLERAGANSV